MHRLARHRPPIPLREGWRTDIDARYRGAGRHYHTVEHLDEMLDRWGDAVWDDPVASWLAVLLHDAVYVVGAPDNEERSAQLVPGWVARFVATPDAVDQALVEAHIRETARHGDHGVLVADTARFVDIDMAILAAPADRFAAYEAQVRAEWLPQVGPDAYEQGRRAFFTGLLARRIFQSADFAHLEAPARANLEAALG